MGTRVLARSLRFRVIPKPPTRVALAPELTLTVIGESQIDVGWILTDRTDADEIDVERATAPGGPYTLITSITTNNTTTGTFSDTGLTAATQYYYRLRSHILSGAQVPYSDYNEEESATTSAAALLNAPTGITVTTASQDADNLNVNGSWNAVTGALSYDYWWEASIEGGFESGSAGSPFNTTGLSVPSVTAITRQLHDDETVLVVAARNASGQGTPGRKAFLVLGNLKPPIFNSAVKNGDDVSLNFTDNPDSDKADKLSIERNVDAGAFSEIALLNLGAAQPQLIDVDRPAGSYIYRGRYRHVDTIQFSGYSAEKQVIIGAPPPSGYILGQQFDQMTSLNDLQLGNPGFDIRTVNNILFDDGTYQCLHMGGAPSGVRGLMYRYQAKPLDCVDQSLTTHANFGNLGGFYDLWCEADVVFSSNWTTANANCTNVNPDHKFIFAWPLPQSQVTSGSKRGEFKVGVGVNSFHITGMGGVSLATKVPKSVYQVNSPIAAPSIWDQQTHRVRCRFTLINNNGRWEDVCQSSVDGQILHSFRGIANQNIGTATYKRMYLGSNRNTGATEEMYVWWQSFYVFVSDPGWFSDLNTPIKDYANLGGGTYIE